MHLARVLVAIVPILGEAALDHRVEAGRCRRREPRRRRIEYRRPQLAAGFCRERKMSRGQLEQDNAEGPDVGAFVRDPAPQQLGRHVGERAGDGLFGRAGSI